MSLNMHFSIILLITKILCISSGKTDEIDNNMTDTIMVERVDEVEKYVWIADPIRVYLFSESAHAFNVSFPCTCFGKDYLVKVYHDFELFEIHGNKSFTMVCDTDHFASRNISSESSAALGFLQATTELTFYGTSLSVSDMTIGIYAPSRINMTAGLNSTNDSPNVASGKYTVSENPDKLNKATAATFIRQKNVTDVSSRLKGIPAELTDSNDVNETKRTIGEPRGKHFDLETDCAVSDTEEAYTIVYSEQIRVMVVKKPNVIDKVFNIVLTLCLCFMSVGFGCVLDLEIVKNCLKRPIAPGIGFGCQYLIMPLIGFSIAKLLPSSVDRSLPLGIFIMAVCPGGGLSNLYTFLLDGDISLSITMTFVSTIASVGMMPLWIYTLGKEFTDEKLNIKIPYKNLFLIIALVTVPIFIGLFLQFKMKRVARSIALILKPACFIFVLFVYAFAIYINILIFRLSTTLHVLSGCMLPYLGYGFGSVIAAILRQPCKRIKTIGLETGMQNAGLAYLLTMTSFPPPHGDLASLAPLLAAIAQPCPPLILSVLYIIWKFYQNKYKSVAIEPKDEKYKSVVIEPKDEMEATQII